MKLNLFKKKTNVTLESLHAKSFSPEKDWLLLLSIFSLILILFAIFSATLFFRVLNENYSTDSNLLETSDQTNAIDTATLQKAVEFIKSRI